MQLNRRWIWSVKYCSLETGLKRQPMTRSFVASRLPDLLRSPVNRWELDTANIKQYQHYLLHHLQKNANTNGQHKTTNSAGNHIQIEMLFGRGDTYNFTKVVFIHSPLANMLPWNGSPPMPSNWSLFKTKKDTLGNMKSNYIQYIHIYDMDCFFGHIRGQHWGNNIYCMSLVIFVHNRNIAFNNTIIER